MAEENRRGKFESLTLAELRQRAREAGYSGVSKLRKQELIGLLLQEPAEPTPSTVASQAQPLDPDLEESPSGIAGGLLRTIGRIGLLLSLLVTLMLPVGVWWVAGKASQSIDVAADNLDQVAVSLEVAAEGLESGVTALKSGSQGLRAANSSLESMDPLLTSVRDLIGDDLPTALEATQLALSSAEDGAAAMDRVLRGLRFFGLNYDPALPLDQSLAQTSNSLEGLPEALRSTEGELSRSQQDLGVMTQDLDRLSEDLDLFAEDIGETAGEIRSVAEQLGQTADSLRQMSQRLPTLRWLGALLAAFFGLWLAALHLNMLTVGRMVRQP
ncbi:MAG: Rho termination factor N-terminal domain-containing protein [Anaerolineales bacterium]